MQSFRFVHAALPRTLATLLLGGCAGSQSASPTATPPSATAASGQAEAEKLPTCMGELEPANDGRIDDFEDGNNQVSALAGRDGYWWSAHDNLGSAFTVPEGPFSTSDDGTGSNQAIHVAGKTVTGSNDAWGVEFGTNFLRVQGGLYDASKYAGIRFRAKAAGGPTTLRVNLGDVNTHADAGVCTTCWNHFRQDFALSDEWRTYTMRYTDLEQREGWGAPRPDHLSADKLVSVSLAIDGGQSFDVWVDDVEFLVCSE